MKLLVPIKRVVSPYVNIRVKSDGSGVDLDRLKMVINPFDEIALEEALRLKERNIATEVVVVAVGGQANQETLRNALAMGADRAILVEDENALEPLNVAKILKEIVKQENPKLVLMGKQAIDGDNNQTGQMLAALLNWPQGTFASKVDIDHEIVTVIREVDGGLETLSLTLPAVITTDLRLNEPRYPSLPNIMKAKTKPLKVVPLMELELNLKPHLSIISVDAPPKRQAGEMVSSVEELVDKLRNEAKVI